MNKHSNHDEDRSLREIFLHKPVSQVLTRRLLSRRELSALRRWMHALTALYSIFSFIGLLFFIHAGVLLVAPWIAAAWLLTTAIALHLIRRSTDVRSEYWYSMLFCSVSVVVWTGLVGDPLSSLIAFCNIIFITFASLALSAGSGFRLLITTFMGLYLVRMLQIGVDADEGLAEGALAWIQASYMGIIYGSHFISICFITSLLYLQKEWNQRARQEAEEASARLLESERARNVFLSTVTHELRTPLTSIRGYIDLMLLDGGANREDLGVVKSAAIRLQDLIDEFVNLADPPSLASRMSFQTFDLSELAVQEIQLLRRRVENEGVHLRLVQSGPCLVYGDRLRTAQVISNLVVNAVDHTTKGKAITVRVHTAEDSAILEVADEGCGIAATDLPHIFSPFFTRQTSAKRKKGTGLGLTICRQIIEATGGEISVESNPNEGATFRVRLPLISQEDAKQPVLKGAGLSALLLDDDLNIRQLMERQLKELGYNVRPVATGTEAIQAAENENFSVLILDVNVPEISGIEVARRCAESGRHGKIFLFSAMPKGEIESALLISNADGFIPKPWEFDWLARRLAHEADSIEAL